MKFLVQNYNTSIHTEAAYFNHIFNALDGCSSTMWTPNSNVSIYDAFDMSQPDIVITHISLVGKDLLLYLSENKNIELVLNITMCNQNSLQKLEDTLNFYNINCKLAFINHCHNNYISKFNIVSIYHGADIFIDAPKIKYNIDTLNITNTADFKKEDSEQTCHYIASDNDLKNSVDKVMNIFDLSAIYNNYQKINIHNFIEPYIVQQVFFDSVYHGNNVSFCGSSDEINEICRILKLDNIKDFNKVKQCVKEKHTCLHRTKSLLSQLNCSSLVSELSVKIGEMDL